MVEDIGSKFESLKSQLNEWTLHTDTQVNHKFIILLN